MDGVRALAVALVWISHLFNRHDAVAALGPIGVRIFFVVSGFIITKLLADERGRTGSVSLKAFYLRRTYRIFPACYVYIAFIVALAVVGVAKELHARDVVLGLSYTSNYATGVHWSLEHLWSLAVEEQFYLLWPVAFVVLPERWARRVLLGTIAVSPLLRVLSYVYLGSQWNVDHMFHTVSDSLATGCLVALGVANWRRSRLYRAVPSAGIYVWLCIAIGAAAMFQQSHRLEYYTAGLTILNLSIALFLVRVTEGEGLLARVLNSTPLVAVGLVSYSLYLWQQPFLYPAEHPHLFQRFPVNLLSATVAAMASYYLVEKPMRRWGARTSRASTAPRAAASA